MAHNPICLQFALPFSLLGEEARLFVSFQSKWGENSFKAKMVPLIGPRRKTTTAIKFIHAPAYPRGTNANMGIREISSVHHALHITYIHMCRQTHAQFC